MVQLCDACAALNLTQADFTTPPFEPEGRYHATAYSGILAVLRTSRHSCDFCQLIWLTIEKSDQEFVLEAGDKEPWSLIWSQSTNDFEPDQDYDGEEDIQDLFHSALFPVFGNDARRGDYGIQFIDEKETDGFLRGRLVDAEIDLQMVKAWIDRCKTLHGPKCNTKVMEDSYLTVIDTKDLCLVNLPKGEEYAALSYVWGDSNFTVTLLNNKKSFETPGGLSVKLPQTVRDAIDVSRALGLQYLWIDALCITQDDASTKQSLIVIMDHIYTNAVLTLVAATASGANCGLSGWSNRQDRDQHCIDLDNGLRVGVLPYYQRELLECEHSKRAWTYQETTLSPRCLIFLNGFVYFNCNVSVYSEHTHAEVTNIWPENSAGTLGKLDTFTTARSVLQRYASRILAFTSRSLTYQSDALNAFEGISSSMISNGDFSNMHFGMPTAYFDWALMWRCDEGAGKKRDVFPSWAWVSRQDTIEMPQLQNNVYEQKWFLKATWVDWYASREDDMCFTLWDSRELENLATEEREDEIDQPQDQEDEESPSDRSRVGGRVSDWDSLSPLPPPHVTREPFRSCSVPRALCFDAPAVTLDIGATRATKTLRSSFNHPLFDREGRICGFLSIDDLVAPDINTTSANFVILSVTSFGDLSRHQHAGLTASIFSAFDMADATEKLREYSERARPELNSDFLNVMYVQETSKMAEVKVGGEKRRKKVEVFQRAGVGFVLREALRQVGRIEWRSVVLV